VHGPGDERAENHQNGFGIDPIVFFTLCCDSI
jgi:hypothetical protein